MSVERCFSIARVRVVNLIGAVPVSFIPTAYLTSLARFLFPLLRLRMQHFQIRNAAKWDVAHFLLYPVLVTIFRGFCSSFFSTGVNDFANARICMCLRQNCIAQELVGSFDKENDSSVIAVRWWRISKYSAGYRLNLELCPRACKRVYHTQRSPVWLQFSSQPVIFRNFVEIGLRNVPDNK